MSPSAGTLTPKSFPRQTRTRQARALLSQQSWRPARRDFERPGSAVERPVGPNWMASQICAAAGSTRAATDDLMVHAPGRQILHCNPSWPSHPLRNAVPPPMPIRCSQSTMSFTSTLASEGQMTRRARSSTNVGATSIVRCVESESSIDGPRRWLRGSGLMGRAGGTASRACP